MVRNEWNTYTLGRYSEQPDETRLRSMNYYVAKNGNDSNPGTRSKPWLTIQYAADVVNPGDVIYIMQGVYNERITLVDRNRIIFKNYGNDGVIIDGTNIYVPWDEGLFQITSSSLITLAGVGIFNSVSNGIKLYAVDAGTHDITVEKCFFNEIARSGISGNIPGIDYKMKNIRIVNNGLTKCCSIGGGEVIRLVDIKDSEIAYNTLYNNYKEDIDILQSAENVKIHHNIIEPTESFSDNPNWIAGVSNPFHGLGIYLDGWDGLIENVEIYNNFISGLAGENILGIRIAAEENGSLHNIRIYNNITKNMLVAFAIGGNPVYDDMRGKKENIHVVNNTFCNSVSNCCQLAGTHWKNLTGFVFRNNILTSSKDDYGMISPGLYSNLDNFEIDHNLFGNTSSDYYGTDYVIGDPLFVDEENNDFRLSSESPAKGKGCSILAPANDFYGNKRLLGVDIGAIQSLGIDLKKLLAIGAVCVVGGLIVYSGARW